jgi:hypothetical protein
VRGWRLSTLLMALDKQTPPITSRELNRIPVTTHASVQKRVAGGRGTVLPTPQTNFPSHSSIQ